MEALHAIVPAGGAGSRLWPLSRRDSPKFLLDITGTGSTLLQQTVARLAPLTQGGSTTVVTGVAHAAAVREQLPQVDPRSVLAEPSPRDSMAAIALAAAVIHHRHGDVVVGSFPADHVVRDQRAFAAAVTEAVAVAQAGYVVTIGIEPREPSTGFGYIRTGALLEGFTSARTATTFTEKPDVATASSYLATGEYRWNAGMFVMRTSVLLAHLARRHPQLAAGAQAIAAAWDTAQQAEVLQERWADLETIAIDHAIAEPVALEGGVAVVPAAMGWDDIGDFARLTAHLPGQDDGAHVRGEGDVIAVESAGAVVLPGTGRTIAVLGIPDAVVVDTGDALLVTTQAHAQRVKDVVTALGEERDHLR